MQKVFSEKAGEMMNPFNAYIHDSLVKLEIATLECEALDLEIERVEFEAASHLALCCEITAKRRIL